VGFVCGLDLYGSGQGPVDGCQHSGRAPGSRRLWGCIYSATSSYLGKFQVSQFIYESRTEEYLPAFRHFMEVQKML
jgi:hypothetical protein